MSDLVPDASALRSNSDAIHRFAFGPWRDLALCAEESPEIFFPVFGDPAIEARVLCANCPVRLECLQYATEADEYGIWGGLNREQRCTRSVSSTVRGETVATDEERKIA